MSKHIQIRNVPDDVHAVYKRRAAAAGMSLQEYLLAELFQGAGRPTMQEVLDRLDRSRGGSTARLHDIVEDIRRDRDSH